MILNTIKECFDVILSGNREESRLAARRVRKLLYSPKGGDKFDDIHNIIDSAPANYALISEDWRQENFVIAVSVIYYLHNKRENPDFLFPWLLQLLIHPKGNIRYASFRMLDTELGPLTVHLRLPDSYPNSLASGQADRILRTLFLTLNSLLGILFQPKYKKYKYLDSLPASPYKSVQMLMVEFEELCGREYVDKLNSDLHKNR